MIPTWQHSSPTRTRGAWPVWVALAALWLMTLAEQYWIYAVLFLAWAVYDLATGESHFIQRVTRRHEPVTYWLVVSTWILLTVLWLIYPSG
ncbi:MAG: hypothetical protein F4X85_08850 [Acidimicrobiaceae bacterium]|nr:hypothetical protein [Acidimicrobiaceae bacterium]